MVRLVEHIAAAPFARKIFGATSMMTLGVAQTPEILPFQEILRVEYSSAGFVITAQERGWTLDVSKDDPIARRVPPDQGIVAFERLLRAKRWD